MAKKEKTNEERIKPLEKIDSSKVLSKSTQNGTMQAPENKPQDLKKIDEKIETYKQMPVLSPWEKMMAERRNSYVKEKTDAEKMQRYHALTDVFNAFGKMGGAAVGGAIGGDALVGASAKEYQPNRGYLDAIEKAKAANDRIRALDDTGFQFQLNKQLRDEQRDYEDKVRTNQWAREDQKIAEQRDYEDKVRQIEMDFRSKESLLQRQWEETMRSKNFEEQAKLEKELLKLRNEYESQLITLKSIYGGTGSGSKLKKITVNGKEYTIDPSNAVSVSEIYNMIPVPEGGLPYGKATYWDGEIVGRDNPTIDEMLVAIGQNVNNEDFIAAFENRFGNNTLAGELEEDMEANGKK
jgi:hypothetical protein